ncbi:flippase [Paenibacillus rhizophilus]|uniref:Flippase n=1 Tax=Paenibacillus rhizophilus TaxID=1850366 RepID=A0A3N9Q156_9BACL|nr:flippase [Paenibacillus rhizophilus]RQW12432.1 flippase [Paenibacillus rhizophilus]
MANLKSIKTNFLYNALLRFLSIIFPLITFPYLARVLSADGVGRIDFVTAIIQYFIIISQVGIPLYAVRQCAKVRDDKEKLSKLVQEILILNFVMVSVSYLLLFISMSFVSQLNEYKSLMIIISINILSVNIGMEWFYQAIEEYRYITLRSLFVKLFSLILVFIFIKEQDDYLLYGIFYVLSLSLGYFYNFVRATKYIDLFKKYKKYNFKKHLKPIMILFFMNLSVSVYINLDKVMLGFISGDKSVGLYTAANKIVSIIVLLITSLGAVMLPRMSYYIENNMEIEKKRLIGKSLDFVLMISIPSAVGIIMLSKQIIFLFAGSDYLDAITTIKIISPIIIAIGLSNLIGIQILVSHGKEKLTLISTLIGASVNFILNLLLISKMQQNGAAISSLIAEICVVLAQFVLAFKYIKGTIKFKNLLGYFLGSTLIVLTCTIIHLLISNLLISTFLSVLLSTLFYYAILYLLKNEFIYGFTNKILKKIQPFRK